MFLFVGEKPSDRALSIGATWENGKLAGKTLREGLIAIGIDPDQQRYCNIFDRMGEINPMIDICRYASENGTTVVGMGKLVGRALDKASITHIKIIHPAARGKIRKTELYQAHLAERLVNNEN